MELNSRGPLELELPAELTELEAAFALSAFREEAAVDEDEAPASACSGPNSRLALAAAGSAAETPARVELEDPPRATGELSTDTSWAFATDELRASCAPDAPAPDARSRWR